MNHFILPQEGNVIIPQTQWNIIETDVLRQSQQPDVMDEQQTAHFLHISKNTLRNYTSNGAIPKSCFTVGVCGHKWFYKLLLMGIKSAKRLAINLNGKLIKKN